MRKREDKAPIKISSLFDVYKKRLRAPQGSVTTAAVEVIKDLLGISIAPTLCEYQPQTRMLRIHAQGPIKSEIFMHRDEILTHLKGRLGERNAPTSIL